MSKFLSLNCVVVGGGSAGVVPAARLSEDASLSVLLLEAGPTFRPSEAPQSVHDASNLAPDPELLRDDNAARPPNAPFELRARNSDLWTKKISHQVFIEDRRKNRPPLTWIDPEVASFCGVHLPQF